MRGAVPGLTARWSVLDVLPGLYQDDQTVRRLAAAFDAALAPAVVALDNLAAYLDPVLTPPDFLRWLGQWVGAVDDPGLADDRRRLLVRGAAEMQARLGTARGLADLVEVVTGERPQIEESGGVAASTEPGTAPPGRGEPELTVRVGDRSDPRLVAAVVAAACPVHVPFRVETGDAR